jgi:hypothetical protein
MVLRVQVVVRLVAVAVLEQLVVLLLVVLDRLLQ